MTRIMCGCGRQFPSALEYNEHVNVIYDEESDMSKWLQIAHAHVPTVDTTDG